MKPLPALELVARLEDAEWLDPVAKKVRKVVKRTIRPKWARDVLHGVPIGHPVHPLAVQVPLGAWISAAVLDAFPGNDRAATVLVGVGAASAVPSAVAGFMDWSQLHNQQQRVGLVHASANITAVSLYAASLVARAQGRQGAGKVLAYLGLGVVSFGGFLGGHLTYRQAAGVNHSEEIPHRFPSGWQSLAPLAELPEGKLHKIVVSEIPLLVYREAEDIRVLSDVCSHLSGPLHEGKLKGGKLQESASADGGSRGGDPCVVCPWHGSTFSLRTGEVQAGPATAKQPHFETRVSDGMVEVCLPGAE
ncbi:Rieske 2Fe-2S domain-containing protein [Pseudarthrobacter phenanthrenivorans]|uniref:Ferredoxin subunit of nitrite reductase and ring-hydroxylating dioxygenase n=1 Tax=Pseudarthrobacter phenanthrenivorans (strain DSM 18606 / JCM 16027 / LMG 23796 / Sphe3) TaxID=930171 RepID=F0M608_PSEPM|nr:Rieske 2Fe-2S domain-containing protein [Pseudarthrobacter phenanthrenivorans]ADX74664.1 ferredoxin subunit of nitrite reductase and ring-hydroxylating dioxygenase [Pseudarthrobacter phenanthrenivorans Sphe3]TPV50544.1 Rieske 2Fe-2S domain-containing protein [Pseudarthrobacter phenanthrenivorans]